MNSDKMDKEVKEILKKQTEVNLSKMHVKYDKNRIQHNSQILHEDPEYRF